MTNACLRDGSTLDDPAIAVGHAGESAGTLVYSRSDVRRAGMSQGIAPCKSGGMASDPVDFTGKEETDVKGGVKTYRSPE